MSRSLFLYSAADSSNFHVSLIDLEDLCTVDIKTALKERNLAVETKVPINNCDVPKRTKNNEKQDTVDVFSPL